MAGIIGCCCSSTLSSRSNLRTSWFVFESHRGQNMTGKLKPVGRRNLVIRAEVNYVNAEEAKELVAVEGYSILDVRDKRQYDRAHIKSCYHVPIFIENNDNDLGLPVLLTSWKLLVSRI
ncbi:hypothetical protein CsSME_00045510 [Camellia sinensis var. sinensis]